MNIHQITHAKIDLSDHSTYHFQDKDDYDQSCFSRAYHERERKAGRGSNWEFNSEPRSFPCIGINICDRYNSDSRDEMIMLWLYPGKLCEFTEE